ncbi:SusC/RagA family TonB-linked outer membrane protein [Pedobacter ginsengisoli]|uniref:SusC/RagA family TonB-linked outer membrane protein n=1 Tax=Pedobacter ginsengisoli TaxID=363852 RepID=UPI002551B010|nr:SusC/RagA family TonB-linked outer membrane protein [Pedobacter ginsengisoli]
MRLTTVLLLASLIHVSAAGLAQKINLKQTNAPLKTVLKELRLQSNFDFIYTDKMLNEAKPVTLDVKNTELTEVLKLVFEKQSLTYSIEDKTVTIQLKTPSFLDNLIARFIDIDVRGRVVDEKGQGLNGASVKIKGTDRAIRTNDKGEFYLPNVDDKATLVIGYLGYKTIEIKAAKDVGPLKLEIETSELEEVNVNTGYYQIPKERATGSFDLIDSKLLNRRVSTNILDRIDGVASGVIFNNGSSRNQGNVPQISVRGRSTLFANAEPLIILDNFPYQGDFNNINPNDIESVTILKDAAAASIWGAFSGNGVVVLTSKKGKRNQTAQISLNSNITLGRKPDLFYPRQLSSSGFIEVEKFLFDKGVYDVFLDYVPYQPQSPAIEILDLKRRNIIDNQETERRLSILGQHDVRNDQLKYFYRTSVNQQHSLSVSGGGQNNQYYISGGFDDIKSNNLNDNTKRFTISSQLTNHFLNDHLELNTRILFTSRKESRPTNGYNPTYPYENVADENGNALAVVKDYRLGFIDTVAQGKLLDWKYYPLNEREANSESNLSDYKVEAGIKYKIIEGLKFQVSYQYGKGFSTGSGIDDESRYIYRNLYNLFTSIDPITGTATYSLPKGSINYIGSSEYSNTFFRSGFTFNRVFSSKHDFNAVAGFEVRKADQFGRNSVLYGYDSVTATNIPVSLTEEFPQFFGGSGKIVDGTSQRGTADRSRAYYINAAYSYSGKYTLSASARKDESNLFGVKANQKGVPLWSAGISWELSKEPFIKSSFFPYLRARFTYGYNGNVDKSAYAATTISFTDGVNQFIQPVANVFNPANPSLQWEKVKTVNAAIDFGIRKNIISGSIEFYSKDGIDLIGYSPVAPQLGVNRYRGNVASTSTNGIDVTLNSINIRGSFRWNSALLFSLVKDEVTKNLTKQNNNFSYVRVNALNPLEGRPYAALYSFKWAGLDSSGDPQGYSEGTVTKNYAQILNSTNASELIYNGSFLPTRFGSLKNTFGYKAVELSFNLLYKGGHYFRKEALQYGALFGGGYKLAYDYPNRWKQIGDENTTTIPAMKYPSDTRRDDFYKYAEINVLKADHIRLQDIQISYEISSANIKKIGFSSINLYSYINNVSILWKANKEGLDPDAGSIGVPAPRTYAVGIRAVFK